MRAIFLEVPEGFLEERRRRDQDRKDEVWDGVVHLVPLAPGIHETVAHELMFVIKPVADRLGLITHGAVRPACSRAK